ncbi:MAG: hypothetical protein ACRDZS_09210 [Acidimicrobiales bacterium]
MLIGWLRQALGLSHLERLGDTGHLDVRGEPRHAAAGRSSELR